jgi:hypothetical protein
MKEYTSDTYWAKIYIAGDYEVAKQVCREYVMKGLCVNISKVDYIYTMGEESGVCVELIQYPRFKRSELSIKQEAGELGKELIEKLHQGSCTVMTAYTTYYLTRKREIEERNEMRERMTE